jgi:lysine-N-methylase
MSWPIRHLTVLQNWDCHSCTNCCRDYRVYVTDEERDRITALDWQQTDLATLPGVVREGPPWSARYRLNQRADGRCIFLGDGGRCRIHERFGADAKPLACRLYPFVLVPTGDHWRVGLRFSCPSAAENQGQRLAGHEDELRTYARQLEKQENVASQPNPPPVLQRGQTVSWPDVLRFVDRLQAILANRDDRLERRWRKCLALADLCRAARFDQVSGSRLNEFLELVTAGLDAEVPADPALVPMPSWVGRILFRQALAVYLRKDVGSERGPAARSRFALLRAAWRFAVGSGPVPRLHTLLPETTFEQVEQASGALPEDAEAILERYYLVKVESLQFCGPVNFGLAFWQGLESLALTLPILLWLRRAFAELPGDRAMIQALRIVDHNFAYSPLLGTRRQRPGLGILTRRGELQRLIAWYAR